MHALIFDTGPQGPLRPQAELHAHVYMSHVCACYTQGALYRKHPQGFQRKLSSSTDEAPQAARLACRCPM
jgi:hypothetical protein